MKIALCQLNIVWEDKSANLKQVEAYTAEAAKGGADIILFPEMSLTGFSMDIAVTKESGESVDIIKSIAAKNNIAIGIGWVRDCGEKGENVYTVADKTGRIIAEYTKIHPFSHSGEDKFFNSGSSLCVFEHCGIKIGVLICYDLRFPEVFQALSKTADLIVVPACWPSLRKEHWDILLRARAIENQCYIAGINCVGEIGGLHYSGDSSLIDPNGKLLSRLSGKDGILFGKIDSNHSEQIFIFSKKDRRPLLYSRLSE